MRIALVCAAFAASFGVASTAIAADNDFTARGSAEQVYATGLAPNAKVKLIDKKGKKVASKQAGAQGGVVFRKVKPGSYTVSAKGQKSGALTVYTTKSAPLDEKVYDQEIASSGYQYMTMRDGTKLAINVHPSSSVTNAAGVSVPVSEDTPRPTLIEYSGYGYADPDGPQSGISIIANLMGFTVVDVNMRGTGCSGGSFDFFEPNQSLDGYDIIETVARQPWVSGGKVGMMGISYGGISQLFTASTQPPSLAAIAPLSVLDQTQTTLYPGGILNTGFALNWAKERVHDSLPASENGGQAWAYEKIQEGDEVCKKNQELHDQAVNLLQKVKRNSHYRAKVADPLAPLTFVDKIDVPVFMACQWTDEQTGGHCPTLAAAFTGTDKKWFTFTNGVHTDSLDPETFNRWYDFMKLYVAKENPAANSAVIQAAAPVVYQSALGVNGVTLPPDPIQQQPTYDAALAAFEKLDSVRILFDNGAGGSEPGQPYPGYEQSWPSWPIPGTAARSWFFADGSALADKKPAAKDTDTFSWDKTARPPTNFTGNTGSGDLWTTNPSYQWSQNPEGTAVSYVTDALTEDTTVVGNGFIKAWVKSSVKNVDLQATITEVRPDGKEAFVQGGWLRADARKLDKAKSTPLSPVLSLRKSDVEPMPADKFVPVTIPLYYQGHSYRAGSQLRVIISAPSGDQPIWAFDKTQPKKPAKISVATGKKMPSKLTLPIVDVNVPTELPPCPGLRGEPCRDYVPFENR